MSLHSSSSGILFPLSYVLSYNLLSPTHQVFYATISANIEPKYFHQDIKSLAWCDAMVAKIKTLEDKNTWTLISLPTGKHPMQIGI